jgi:threonine dehydratase
MEKGAAMYECQRVGKPIYVKEEVTLADALGGGIGLDNKYTFQMTRELVDDIVLVSESDIEEGIRHAYWKEYQILEGSGAVAIAALIAKKVRPNGSTLALMCGSNIDLSLHHKIISKRLT